MRPPRRSTTTSCSTPHQNQVRRSGSDRYPEVGPDSGGGNCGTNPLQKPIILLNSGKMLYRSKSGTVKQETINDEKSCKVKTKMNTSTSEAGGCHYAGIALCSSRTRTTRNTICQLRKDCYLPPVNGLLDGILSCSPISSSFSWFLTYSAIRLSFFPTVST